MIESHFTNMQRVVIQRIIGNLNTPRVSFMM